MQLRKLVILLLLLVDVCALKGTRLHSRGLADKNGNDEKGGDNKKSDKDTQDEKGGDNKKPDKDTQDEKVKDDKKKEKGDKDGNDVKNEKGKEKKKTDKEKKKKDKGAKCKNNPVKVEKKEKESEDSDNSYRRLEEVEVDNILAMHGEDLLDCLVLGTDADCSALLAGESPSVPDSADGAAGGTLKLEVTLKSEDTVEQLRRSLEKVALTVVGCDASGSERKLQAGNETNTTTAVVLNGLTVGELSKVGNNCSISGVEENCTILETPFTIYFSGNATVDHLNSMAYLLSDTVLAESDNGDYDEFADVHHVEAIVDEGALDGNLVESPKTAMNGANILGIVGGAVGGLAVVTGGAAGYMYYQSRQGASVNPLAK